MRILKKINQFRRTVMGRITKNIGHARFDDHTGRMIDANIKSILICRPNGRLGNLLLITPLVQEVIATFPHCKIDLFVKGGLAETLFLNYANINRIIQLPRKPFKSLGKYIQAWLSIRKHRYDIVINVVKNSSSGRLSTQLVNARYKFFGDDLTDTQWNRDHEHIAKFPVYNFRSYLAQWGFTKSNNPVAPLDLRLSAAELAEGKKILKELVNNTRQTICLFTYATGDKCYSESWWETFYTRLKKEYSSHNIIEVLPVENISKISFKATTFYSKDIRQIGSLIANTDVFIGADSGIMHLASAVHTPTLGLFSITNGDAYGPYNNNSVAINTNNTTIDECVGILRTILTKGETVPKTDNHFATT